MSLAVLPPFAADVSFADSATGLADDLHPDEQTENDDGTAGPFKLSLVADARNSMFTREERGFCPRKPGSLDDSGLSRDFVE